MVNKTPASAEDALTEQPPIEPHIEPHIEPRIAAPVAARVAAKERYGLLNAALPAWLHDLTARNDSAREFDALTVRLKYIQLDRKYSRHEIKDTLERH